MTQIKYTGQGPLSWLISKCKATFWPKSDVVNASTLGIDTTPTASSGNLVTSGGVKTYVDGKVPATYAGSPTAGGFANKAVAIPFGEVDSTSTSTAFTATVDNFPSVLSDGVCAYIRNDVVSSAEGYTLNINGTGAKPVYSSIADETRDKTIFTAARTFLFVYNSKRVTGGCWDLYYGMYAADTDVIANQIRTQSISLIPLKYKTYRYRMLFLSPDGDKLIPSNTSTSTSATAAKTVIGDKINPFGPILYYSSTGAVEAGSSPTATYLWEQYGGIALGYAFNTTGAAWSMTVGDLVYLKCAPQADGMAIIDSSTPIVFSLPTTDDGKIYIYLGIVSDAAKIEMHFQHPIFYHDGTGIRVWTGKAIPDAVEANPTVPAGTTPTTLANLKVGSGYYGLAAYPKYHLCTDEAEYEAIQNPDAGTLYLIPES